MKQLHLYISEDLHERLRREAFDNRISISQLVVGKIDLPPKQEYKDLLKGEQEAMDLMHPTGGVINRPNKKLFGGAHGSGKIFAQTIDPYDKTVAPTINNKPVKLCKHGYIPKLCKHQECRK